MPYPIRGIGSPVLGQQATNGGGSHGGSSGGGWVGPLVGAVIGGVIDAISQDRSNKATAKNVQAQIDFQREQSETQYQRAVADMRAAGLNPALAYKQGGNSTQGGAAAENRPLIQNSAVRLQQAVSAYNDFANGTAQRELIRAQTSATDAQAYKATMEGRILEPEEQATTDPEYRRDYILARKARAKSDIYLNRGAPEQFDLGLGQARQAISTAKAAEAEARSRATLNEQQYQNVWFRKNISPYVNSTAKALQILKPMGKFD